MRSHFHRSTLGALGLGLGLGLGLALGAACAGPAPAPEPGADGLLRLRIWGFEPVDAELGAIVGAMDQCAERGQQAVFVEQTMRYTGTLDEAARRSRGPAALSLARSPRSPGPRHSSARLRAAGTVSRKNPVSGQDYVAEVAYRCGP